MGTMVITMMMSTSGTTNSTNVTFTNNTQQNPQNPNSNPNSSVFHDFLGRKAATFHGETGPSPSSSAASSSGLRHLCSTTSDLDRQMGSQLERMSCYGPRNDHSVAETTNRLVGSKRSSNSESTLIGSSREGFLRFVPEKSHVTKMLHSASGGERLGASHYDTPLQGALQMRPVSASFALQPTTGTNTNFEKSQRLHNTFIWQSSVSHHIPSSRFRDGSSGSLILSQLAADEGSRTGNKSSGILNSITVRNVISERNPSALLPSRGHNAELESSYPPSRRGATSIGRQMTIIYGGQVHVFDDVHPNKADVIMALAGSSGGCWSTNLLKASATATRNDDCLPSEANETSAAGDPSLTEKYCSYLSGVVITQNAGSSGQAAEFSLEPEH